jgi:hypothetical protein
MKTASVNFAFKATFPRGRAETADFAKGCFAGLRVGYKSILEPVFWGHDHFLNRVCDLGPKTGRKAFDPKPVPALCSPRPLRTQRPAVSGARSRRAGEHAENEVPVLHRSPGSCRESKRRTPCETGTLFYPHARAGKNQMSRHQALNNSGRYVLFSLTFAECRALTRFKTRHFARCTKADDIVAFLFKIALMHPWTLTKWVNSAVAYSSAEGLNQNRYIVSRIAAHHIYRKGRWS